MRHSTQSNYFRRVTSVLGLKIFLQQSRLNVCLMLQKV
jgi:hypothetical protein